MKTSALIAIFLAVATLLPANNSPDLEFLKCRDFISNLNIDLNMANLVHLDLVNGLWSMDTKHGTRQLFQFNDDGLAEILIRSREGYTSYASYQWRIQTVDNYAFLVLTVEGKMEEQLLRVEQTCEGIILTNVLEHYTMYLKYEPTEKPVRVNQTKRYLVGEWTNVTLFENTRNCENKNGAFLSYVFQADGTYTCNYGSKSNKVDEHGSWEVSKDGQFLLLYISEDNYPENTRETKVIKIAQVDDHGLILEQAMKTNDISQFFCADTRSFAFIK